jgi:micrococcal nuclease
MDDKLFWYRAKVRRVVDGDTIDLEFDLGLDAYRHERVRLYGVDAPEIYGVKKESEEYARGVSAKEFVTECLEGKMVWVNTIKDKTGKYGRYLAHVYFQDDSGAHVSISKLLLEDGLAKEAEY